MYRSIPFLFCNRIFVPRPLKYLLPFFLLFAFSGRAQTISPIGNAANNANLQLSFSYTPNVCSGFTVQFTGSASGGQSPYSFFWDFGGGNTDTGQTASHIFTSLGCGTAGFPVKMVVTDANGVKDSLTDPAVTIKQAPRVGLKNHNAPFSNPPFNNCFSADPANPNYQVFAANASIDSACISSYSINWGDGSPNNMAPPFPQAHTYTSIGIFNLVVTGAGTNGCNNSQNYQVLNITNPGGGLSSISGTLTGLCAPASVPLIITNWFDNHSSTMYYLDWGDGHIDTFTHPLKLNNSPDTVYHTYTTSSCPANGFTATLYTKNACRTEISIKAPIEVFIKPKASFNAPANACVGALVPFTNTTQGGYYGVNCSSASLVSWNFGDGSPLSSTQNPVHPYTAAGTYTVTLISTNGCGSDTFTRQICITAPPVPGFTVDTATICLPGTVQTTNITIPGTCTAVSYQWSVTYATGYCGTAAGWAFASGSNANSVSPGFIFTGPGLYTIRLTVNGPCGPLSVSKVIKVRKRPNALPLNFPTVFCDSAVICPSVTATNCADSTLTYLWLLDGVPVANAQNAVPGCFTVFTPGNHTLSVKVSNECGDTLVSRNFTISPSPQLTIGIPPSTVYCPGNLTGDFSFSSSTPGANISWTNDNVLIGLGISGSGSISSFTAQNSTAVTQTATITVTATLNGCSKQSTFTITVKPRPALPAVINPVNYCKDDVAVPLSATALPGHTLLWYNTAAGGTGSATPPTPVTTVTGTTSYYVSQTNTTTGCESNRAAIVVNVSPVPVISGSAGNPGGCGLANGSITLTGLTPGVYTVQYTQVGVGTVTQNLSANASGNIIIGALAAGSYINVTASQNGCISNIAGPFVLVDPGPPATPVAGYNGPLCEGLSLQLTASSATAGVSYSWTGPGFISTLQNPVINPVTPANAGTYTVTAKLNNCTSLPGQVAVVVHPRPAAPTVNAGITVCAGDTIRLTGSTNFPGPVTYAWSGPNGFSSTLQNPVIPNAATVMSGAYTLVVTSVTGNCASPAANSNVLVRPLPVISSASHVNPVGCNTNTGFIVLNGLVPLTSYTVQYSLNGGAPVILALVSNNAGTITINFLSAGIYSNVSVSLNGCRSNIVGPFMLTDTAPFSVDASTNGAICAGSNLLLNASITTTGNAVYAWSGPNGFTSPQQNPVIPNAGTVYNGTFYVAVAVNGCTVTDSVTATVSAPAIGGFTGPADTVCRDSNSGVINLGGHLGAVLRWESSINNGAGWTIINNTTPTLNYNQLPITTWFRAVVKNGACPQVYSDTTRIAVVRGVESVFTTPFGPEACTIDSLFTFTATPVYSGTDAVSYTWYVNGQPYATGNPFALLYRVPPFAQRDSVIWIQVKAENSFGCGVFSDTNRLSLHPKAVMWITKSNDINCVKGTATLTLPPNNAYQWRPNNYISQVAGSIFTVNPPVTTTYHFTGTTPNNCIVEDSIVVVVNRGAGGGKFEMPSAFSPNGDGVNDCLDIRALGFIDGGKDFAFLIFNRLGQLVFKAKNPYDCWDGNLNRVAQPGDTYVYYIRARTLCDSQVTTRKGTVILMR